MSRLVAPPVTACLEQATTSYTHHFMLTGGLDSTPRPAGMSMFVCENPVDAPMPRTDPKAYYLRDVLRLPDGKTEEELDEELRNQARLLGVDVDALARYEEPPLPATRVPSASITRKSQESITSKASQSTGLASDYSDISKETAHLNGRGRRRLSLKDYDSFLARGVRSGRQSMSFTPPTTPSQSTFSLPLALSPESSPRRHFRRIRGLSVLKLGRAESSTSLNAVCPHCPQDAASRRRAMHKLPCGHKLCTKALRDTINAATESETGEVPSCCGRPVPGNLIEHVMTQPEQTALLARLEHWDEAALSTTSTRRASAYSHVAVRHVVSHDLIATGPLTTDVVPQLWHDLDELREREDFESLRQDEADLQDRFTAWIDEQRASLALHQAHLIQQLTDVHETAIEELLNVQSTATSEAEDKQVNAEADMRKFHSQEKRDNATALMHMEAFCAGTYRTGELHMRTVTDLDLAELEKARRIRARMDSKHENAVNVLRGEQNRRLKVRAQRHDKEVQDLRRMQVEEEVSLERVYVSELQQLDASVAQNKHTMRVRLQIRTALKIKTLELGESVAARRSVAIVEWQPPFAKSEMILAAMTDRDSETTETLEARLRLY